MDGWLCSRFAIYILSGIRMFIAIKGNKLYKQFIYLIIHEIQTICAPIFYLNFNNIQIYMRLANSTGYNLKDQVYFSQFQNKVLPGYKKNSTASWNIEGNMLATAENSLKIWAYNEINGMQSLTQSRSNDSSINQVKFYQQNLLVTINRDTLRLWDVRQFYKPIKTEKKNKPDMLSIAWNHDTKAPIFSILSKDNTIGIYDFRNLAINEPIHSQKNKNDITEIEWDQSGSVLFCAGGDSSSSVLMMYNPQMELISDVVSLHNSKINSIAIDPSNQFIATCSDDSLVAINTLPDIICQRTYSHTDCSLKKVAFSSKGEYLATSCQQPKVQLVSNKGEQIKVIVQEPCIDFYNVRTGGHAHRIKCGSTPQTLEWHPKKPLLVYFDFDEQDRKRPGNEKQQRYLHIFSI